MNNGTGDVPSRESSLAAKECGGKGDELDYLIGIITQTFLLLVISHLLHLVLRRLGQPTAISQVVAGVLMGRTGIGSIPKITNIVYPEASMDYLSSTAAIGRMFYMFLVGLELDLAIFLPTIRSALVIAGGGAVACLIFGGAFSPIVYWQTKAAGSRTFFAFTLMLVFTDTASPILIRIITEMRLATTDFGRLAIATAIVNDIACLVILALVTSSPGRNFSAGQVVGSAIGVFALVGGSAYLTRPTVRWLNRRNKQRKHIKSTETVSLIMFVIGISSITEVMGYNSMITSFILGLFFPREGNTTRTLVHRLTYTVNNLLLPVYIGYAGMQTSLWVLYSGRFVGALFTVFALSTAAKVGGTVLAARHLHVPLHQGLVLGFLMNVKGHVDLITLGLVRDHQIWAADAFMILLANVIVSTLIAGPAVAALANRERRALRLGGGGVEHQPPEAELRVLACVHSPRDAPAVLNLVELLNGSKQMPLAINLLHLVELPQKATTAVLYHQQEELEDGEDDDYGGDSAKQINVAVDAFMVETRILVRQATAVATFPKMHEDICERADSIRASMIILPFHRFQRVDGKMVSGKEGIRTTNGKVLQHGKGTVGVLVDRGLGFTTQITAAEKSFHVVALFFGGPDDREAVALGCRLAMNPCVSLTVMRFQVGRPPKEEQAQGITVQESKEEEILMAIGQLEKESDADEAFLSDFYNKYVVSGTVKYVEEFVNSREYMVEAMNKMEDEYSLCLVGRGKRSLPVAMAELRACEEYPELGPVGDFLASAESHITASILILQQQGSGNDVGDLDFTNSL